MAASLPKSSDFKLVDVWLVFCIFSTFLIIVFHVIIDLLQFAEAQEALGRPGTLVPSSEQAAGENALYPQSTKELGPSHASKRFRGFPYNSVQVGWESKEKKSKDLSTVKPNRWGLRIRLTMRGMEWFGRIFVALVFVVFNVIYWLSAYTTS